MDILTPNEFGKLQIKTLEDFEELNEIKLPNDYREFLIKFNGGGPYPNGVALQYGDTDVQYIFGMHDGPFYSNFFAYLDAYVDRVPTGYIPIANDSGGNLFIMSLRPENFGEISFWRHEFELKEGDTADYFDNTEVLTNSFGSFLKMLK